MLGVHPCRTLGGHDEHLARIQVDEAQRPGNVVFGDSANITRSPEVLAAPSGKGENATWQKRLLGLR
jgi:hypothetical protein